MGTDIHLAVQARLNDKWEDTNTHVPAHARERNYELFAFLADVRNGYGFAGVKTGEPVVPQFADRGLPDGEGERDYLGDHSFTWATLRELYEAPWDTTFTSTGVVYESTYLAWDRTGSPRSWCGGIMGKDIVVIDEAAYPAHIKAPNERTHIRVTWTWKPLIECGFRRWVDSLVAEGRDLDNTRVLIGFDS